MKAEKIRERLLAKLTQKSKTGKRKHTLKSLSVKSGVPVMTIQEFLMSGTDPRTSTMEKLRAVA